MSGIRISLTSEAATRAFAQAFAAELKAGDILLLKGPIGAGKTFFARALIQARLRAAGLYEDVPSPTFTLVQTYADDTCEIWHADLYRLGGPDEIAELGLNDAFETAISIVEWPERMGDESPADALMLEFSVGLDETRREVRATGPARWLSRVSGIQSALLVDGT